MRQSNVVVKLSNKANDTNIIDQAQALLGILAAISSALGTNSLGRHRHSLDLVACLGLIAAWLEVEIFLDPVSTGVNFCTVISRTHFAPDAL